MRVAVVGCGGIGGVIAGNLVRDGYDVTAVTGNPTIAAEIQKSGLRIEEAKESFRVDLAAFEALDRPHRFDIALLAVPPNALSDAYQSVEKHLSGTAQVVTLANGLSEERMSEVVPAFQLVGGIVSFGGSMKGPGQVTRTAAGGFTLGRLENRHPPDLALERVADVLGSVGPVKMTENLRGARWSKLAINCAISAVGTVSGRKLGELIPRRWARRLCLDAMTEAVDVAKACGVSLEKVAGTLDLDWLALDADQRDMPGSPGLVARHGVLLAVGAKFRNLRSSMLAAIERGRVPPVAYLNGEVVTRGEVKGIPTPVNRALHDKILEIADGSARPKLKLLKQVYQATR